MEPLQILELKKYWDIEIYSDEYSIDKNGELTFLDLASNQIQDLSPLNELKQLTHLILWDNQINDLSYLKELKQLQILDIRDNQIRDLTPLQELKQLTKLDLHRNQISDLTPIQELAQLEILDLRQNQINELTPLKNLKRVNELYLRYNLISDITPLSELTQLRILDLGLNQIRDLTPLQELSQLEILDLGGNKINELTPLKGLKRLNALYLSDNQISDIDPLKELKQLNKLFLTDNQITNINSLKGLIAKNIPISPNYSYWEAAIYLHNNPLPTALIETIQQGNQAVLDYLDNLEKEESKGARPLNEAKMIIIGEPDAGKTTLMNYLLGKPFTETKTTQGIKIEPWEITDEAGTPYRINIWDFGGQEIQSTVHRFFLTQDTLYVVLLNARKDEKPDKYLEQIRSYAPNSPVLIVINRMDENYGSVDESRLMEEYRTPSGERIIKGIYKTSIRKAHEFNDPYFLPGVQELEAGIIRELLQMPNLRQTVPSNYFEVKNYLESRFFKDEPYITYERYETICREKNLETASDEALLMILDRLGTVRYFNKMYMNHLHILNPEWLSDGVYRILTDKHTHDLQGVITEKDFSRILYKTDAHTFNYPKQHYWYLIEMIKQFSLGYENPTTHQIFLPQAFQSDYPAGFRPEDFKTDALHFFFRYETFIPVGVISSFIASSFGQVRGHLYWQKGIVIEQRELEKVQTALVMQTDTKNRIDIWVQGQGLHRLEFFVKIRDQFRKFHERYPGLKVDEMIGLDARRETDVKYRVLIAHKHNGKTEYTDEEGNDHNIDRLLGMFEDSENTKKAIQQTFNIHGNYYEIRGANKIIIQQAREISEELESIKQELTESNQTQIQSLIDLLAELQKAESSKKAKGVLAQLKETAKNLPKIASEEAVKWATKTTLDGVPFSEKFDSLKERLLNLLQQEGFQDWIKPDNWG